MIAKGNTYKENEQSKSLPLLNFVDSLFEKIDFSNTLIVACQHLLESNFIMFEHLFKRGLKAQNTFIIGKCYSAHPEIIKKFSQMGAYIDPKSTHFDSHITFDQQVEQYIQNFVSKIVELVNIKDYERIIIVDDGGFLIKHINERINNSNIVAVEQTTSGYKKLYKEKLSFPVVNMARSIAKLQYEAPLIAKLCAKQFRESIKELNKKISRILILGNGAIGSYLLRELSPDFFVSVYDQDPKRSDFHESIQLKHLISKFDAILGCTGNMSFPLENLPHLKGETILASVSSSDREFPSAYLRKHLEKYEDCHKHINVKGIFLLNSGFPINFYGGKNSLENEDAQLTRALMLSSIYLATSKNYPTGLVPLDLNIQEKIINMYETLKS